MPKKPNINRGRRPRNYRNRSSRGGQKPTMETPANKVEFPAGLTFYCRNRKQIIDIKPKTFDFAQDLKEYAKKEGTEDLEFDVVYGTERSIKQYFKIADSKFDEERREREMKAAQADKL